MGELLEAAERSAAQHAAAAGELEAARSAQREAADERDRLAAVVQEASLKQVLKHYTVQCCARSMMLRAFSNPESSCSMGVL